MQVILNILCKELNHQSQLLPKCHSNIKLLHKHLIHSFISPKIFVQVFLDIQQLMKSLLKNNNHLNLLTQYHYFKWYQILYKAFPKKIQKAYTKAIILINLKSNHFFHRNHILNIRWQGIFYRHIYRNLLNILLLQMYSTY